jgi:hypothetical protein
MSHSLAGSVMQNWINKHQGAANRYKNWNILGQVLLSTVIDRKYISILEDGKSKIDFNHPILTVSGEMDGIMRLSRVAE